MALIKLIARRGFIHEGRAYREGESFEAPALPASILVWRHHAAFAPRTVTPTTTELPPQPESTSRRHSKRRDVTPEPPEYAESKRRDLTPERED